MAEAVSTVTSIVNREVIGSIPITRKGLAQSVERL